MQERNDAGELAQQDSRSNDTGAPESQDKLTAEQTKELQALEEALEDEGDPMADDIDADESDEDEDAAEMGA